MTTVTLRSPADGLVDLVIAKNGECAVYALSSDQLRLIAAQSVELLCRHAERQDPAGLQGSALESPSDQA